MARRGLLHLEGELWRFGDECNRGLWRSLRDPELKSSDSRGDQWHSLIGLSDTIENDRREVWLVIEGSKDALAAAEIAHRQGKLARVGILAALGSGYRPHRAELEKLRGRKVVVIGDNDAAGCATTQIVTDAMEAVGVEHSTWNLDGTQAKDLYEWLTRADNPIAQTGGVDTKSNEKFLPPLPLPKCSRVQVFKCSSQETGAAEAGLSDDEKLGIVYPFIVTTASTGNRMSFLLARSIRNRKLSKPEIEEIFYLWFTKSQPLLPPDANEDKALQTFYRQMRRVRYTDDALKAACERARKTKSPFIPARDGDEVVGALASLCRELQRNMGDRPFICPVGVAQQFLGVKGRATAAWFLTVLEDEKVIECVDRGKPNEKGIKGKPTFWRYKLPLDQ